MASQPKPPNPYQQAAAQQAAESGAAQSSAIINNPNIQNPFGSQSYDIAGWETVYDAQGKPQRVPRYTQTTTLSPDQMKLLGLQTQMQGNLGKIGVEQSARVGQALGQPFGTEGLPGWSQYRRDEGPTDRAAIEEAMLGRYKERSGKQRSAEDVQMAARGLMPGSQQAGFMADERNRQDVDAWQQAYLGSGQEARAAQEAYNAATGQQNELRGAQLQEQAYLRQLPLQEAIALMTGAQPTIPQFPSFSRQGVNAAPVGSYIGDNYARQAQAASNFNSGLFGLGGSLLGMFA
jgi:hypothetical protein